MTFVLIVPQKIGRKDWNVPKSVWRLRMYVCMYNKIWKRDVAATIGASRLAKKLRFFVFKFIGLWLSSGQHNLALMGGNLQRIASIFSGCISWVCLSLPCLCPSMCMSPCSTVCMSLPLVCLSLPCACHYRLHVLHVCMSPLCMSRRMFIPPSVSSSRMYVLPMCTIQYVQPCICPNMCMSLWVYVPPFLFFRRM